MTTFPELTDSVAEASGEPLRLPYKGTTYEFTGDLSIKRALEFNMMRAEGQRMLAAELAGEEYDSTAFREQFKTFDQETMYLELIGDENLELMKANGLKYSEMVHFGLTLYSWHMVGSAAALRTWTKQDGDDRPPVEGSGTSKARTTSRTGSTTKTSRKPAASHGKITSRAGASSKRTSTASTGSTSRTRKS